MTTDIKEWIAAGRKYADAIDKDRGFESGLTDCLRGLSDALEAMVGEVERLKREAEVHEDETVAMTGGMYADMKIKAQLTAERDRLKAALVKAVAMLRPHYEDDYLQSKFSEALRGDAS